MNEEEEKKALFTLNEINPDILSDEENEAITIINFLIKKQSKKIEMQNKLIDLHDMWEERDLIYENKKNMKEIEQLKEEIKEKQTIIYAGAEKVTLLEKEIEKLKEEQCCITTCLRKDKKQVFLEQKIKDKIEELEKMNFNDYTGMQDGNEVKYEILLNIKELLESEK